MLNPKIVHIEFAGTHRHEYFSSIKAAYQKHNRDDMGISYRALVNALHGTGVYENKRIIVRIGKIESAKQNTPNK